MTTIVVKDAGFSDCRTYRYWLSRVWDKHHPPLCVIGLNPSTADETQDDPTIRRCMRFARDWDFGGLVMVNLFARRATNPKELYAYGGIDSVGPQNDQHLAGCAFGAGQILAAWGAHGRFLDRGRAVIRMLQAQRVELYCLGLTQGGQPRHPLYVRADQQPILLT